MLGSYVQQQRYNMDLKELLNTLTLLEGTMKDAEKHSKGPKFTGYWKGDDPKTPGKHMVGGSEQEESVSKPDLSMDTSYIKDIHNLVKERAKEKELEEAYQSFLQQLEEEDLGVAPKRPGRKGSRPSREYTKKGQPSKRYNYEKTDEDMAGVGAAAQKPGQPLDISKMTPQQKQELVKQMDPNAAKKAMAATTQLKTATGSTASAPDLMRALDSASQGKAVGPKEMTALKPVMGLVKQVSSDPKLAAQLKSLASQAKSST